MSQDMKPLAYHCPWCGRDYTVFVVKRAKPKRYLGCACGMNSYLVEVGGSERAGVGKEHHAKKNA